LELAVDARNISSEFKMHVNAPSDQFGFCGNAKKHFTIAVMFAIVSALRAVSSAG
jgi:hypothetical protein